MPEDRQSPDPRYGPWKFIHEIELRDLIAHPVWLWCMQLGLPDEEDGPLDGDETSMRPLLESDVVPMEHVAPPLILLKVQGAEYYASALFEPQDKKLASISIYVGSKSVLPKNVADLPNELRYVAVPVIGGSREVAFLGTKSSDEATQIA